MIITVKKASRKRLPVFERLMQLYLYDFSEIEGFDINQDGSFGPASFRLETYWTEPDRFPFLIYANSKIAGFVLVNTYTRLSENNGAKSIAEFFILRKYRRRGIGRQAAFYVFDRFPGKWEVRQIRSNLDGYRFWKRIIAEYTNNQFTETFLDEKAWRGPVQSFDNSARNPAHTNAARLVQK